MVKTSPMKSGCNCKKDSFNQDYDIHKVIHSGQCENESCKCKEKSPAAKKHQRTHRLELTANLLTGLSEIDNQHRKLFDMGNTILFSDTSKPESSVKHFGEALVFLARYVNYHFLGEEDAMERYGYKHLENHKKQHRKFRDDLKDLLKRARDEGPTKHLKLKFHYMLSDWFAYHIKHTDRVFVDFIKQQNNSEPVKESKELRKVGIAIEDLMGNIDYTPIEFESTMDVNPSN